MLVLAACCLQWDFPLDTCIFIKCFVSVFNCWQCGFPRRTTLSSAIKCEQGLLLADCLRWVPFVHILRAILFFRGRRSFFAIGFPIFSAMEACGRAGQWSSALGLLAEVRDNGLQPDAFTLNAVMDALGRYGLSPPRNFREYHTFYNQIQPYPIPVLSARMIRATRFPCPAPIRCSCSFFLLVPFQIRRD